MINLLSGFSELRTFPLPSVSLVVLTCSGSQQILLPGGYCSDASPDLAPWNEQTSWCAYSTTCDGIYCKRQEQFFTALNWQYEKLYQRQQELLFYWLFWCFGCRDDVRFFIFFWLHDHNYRMPQACACEWDGHANVKIFKMMLDKPSPWPVSRGTTISEGPASKINTDSLK